jgi:Fur family peroxide stress response transcriptional regulator
MGTELAARGLRATRQRLAVLRVLRRRRLHPTAAEIHRAASREISNLSLKTVYQVLDSFVAAGLASCVATGGEACRYEAKTDPHYHAKCRICGRLFDVPANCNGQIQGRSPLPEGFAVEEIAVTIVGRCPRCRDRI